MALQDAEELESILTGKLPSGWEDSLPTFTPEDKGLATRLHSQTMLNALATAIPGGCRASLLQRSTGKNFMPGCFGHLATHMERHL